MQSLGYLALIERFKLEVMNPAIHSYLLERGERHRRIDGWIVEESYPPQYNPGEDWPVQLTFALKHEGVNLEVLSALFAQINAADIVAIVQASPCGRYARLAWFYYEWLTGKRLPLEDLTQGNYVPALDPELYYALTDAYATRIRRQRVINNLPGTPAYCPLVRRTATLQKYETSRLDQHAAECIKQFPAEIIYRATQYLYLKETKSSYEIEHLQPDQRRSSRFVDLLRQAGKTDCFTEQELTLLQNAIVDERYAADGFRDFQNYIGQSLSPARELIHFVPPRPEDLPELMTGWMNVCRKMQQAQVGAVVTAAIAGFGFVFLHPFEDGNGRLHRYLIHHILAACNFVPAGVIFPVSALMLKQLRRYDQMLESYSRELMRHIEYRLNELGEMKVINQSVAFYRYPDLTYIAEELFGFIEETVNTELVAELEYLAAYDTTRRRMRDVVDMPGRKADLFIQLCRQGNGKISAAKRNLFAELSDDEVSALEKTVKITILPAPKAF